MVFAEYPEPSESVKLLWHETFKDLDIDLTLEAIKELIKSKTYGTPKIADFWQHYQQIIKIKLPEELQLKAEEAWRTNTPIALETIKKVNRIYPKIDSSRQFTSPEELAKANHFNDIERKKIFKEIYEKLKEEEVRKIIKTSPNCLESKKDTKLLSD
jgi:hypothetical protein